MQSPKASKCDDSIKKSPDLAMVEFSANSLELAAVAFHSQCLFRLACSFNYCVRMRKFVARVFYSVLSPLAKSGHTHICKVLYKHLVSSLINYCSSECPVSMQ